MDPPSYVAFLQPVMRDVISDGERDSCCLSLISSSLQVELELFHNFISGNPDFQWSMYINVTEFYLNSKQGFQGLVEKNLFSWAMFFKPVTSQLCWAYTLVLMG